jgi:MFS family permease
MSYWARVIGIPFIGTVGGTLMVAGLAFEAARRGASLFELGMMTAAFQLLRALGSPLGGVLSDRARSRKPFAVAGALGIIAAICLALVVPGLFGLIVARGLQGLSAGFLWPAMQTVVTETSRNAGTALSAYFAVGELGRSGGLALFSRIPGHHFGLTLVAALTALVLTMILVAFTVPRGVARRPNGCLLSGRWRDGASIFLAAAFAGGVVALSNEVILGYLGIVRDLGESGAALALLSANLLAQAAMFGVARIAERGSYSLAALLAFSMMGAGALALPFVPNVALTAPLTALLGGAYSFTPLSRLLAGKIEPERLGTSIGLMNMSANVGGVFFPPAMGGLIALHSGGSSPLDPWVLLGGLAIATGLVLAFAVLPRLNLAGGETG